MSKAFLNIAEASEFLGVSVPTVRNIVKSGKLTYYSAGGRGNIIQFRESDLVAYMERKKVQSAI